MRVFLSLYFVEVRKKFNGFMLAENQPLEIRPLEVKLALYYRRTYAIIKPT
jgi:hypothetical protein